MEGPSENVLAPVKMVIRAHEPRHTMKNLPYLLPLLHIPMVLIAAAAIAQDAKLPEGLVKAAAAFRAAPITNRYAEAENLCKELPRCPLKYQEDVGTGTYRSYDLSKPSYILSTGAVFKLLGDPTIARTNETSVHFLYLARRKHGLPASGDWFLDIQFLSDRAVISNMSTAGPRSNNKNRVNQKTPFNIVLSVSRNHTTGVTTRLFR
jgi:hypothetical protein